MQLTTSANTQQLARKLGQLQAQLSQLPANIAQGEQLYLTFTCHFTAEIIEELQQFLVATMSHQRKQKGGL